MFKKQWWQGTAPAAGSFNVECTIRTSTQVNYSAKQLHKRVGKNNDSQTTETFKLYFTVKRGNNIYVLNFWLAWSVS